MQAVSLPTCPPRPPAAGAAQRLTARPHRRSEVDLAWIAGELGLAHNERRTIINKLRLLAEHSGFPLPKRPRFVAGARITGPASICALSIWDRDPVDRWLEDDRPPAESAALTELRRNAAAEEMTRRAEGLVLVAANG